MPPPDALDPRQAFITREEASNIALAAAKEASRQVINETFAVLGVNLSNFESIQKFRETLEWAERGKNLSNVTGRRMWTTIVSIASAGLAITLWEWAKEFFTKH